MPQVKTTPQINPKLAVIVEFNHKWRLAVGPCLRGQIPKFCILNLFTPPPFTAASAGVRPRRIGALPVALVTPSDPFNGSAIQQAPSSSPATPKQRQAHQLTAPTSSHATFSISLMFPLGGEVLYCRKQFFRVFIQYSGGKLMV